jgi:tripartite-type tricarboxylate transporter receptor subunit TctC
MKALPFLASAIAFLACIGVVKAQGFPAKPITLIAPWPAAGATDVELRALADAAEKYLGQRILIKNMPGASGTLGPIDMAETATPDGYTISQIPIALFRVPFTRATKFDPTRDLTYIIQITGYAFGVVVRSDAPWKTFQAFIDDARAHPGKINYGTSGVGSTPDLTMQMIARQSGIEWIQVPFKGVAEGVNALLAGYIQADADGSGWAPEVNAGQFRLLVTWGAHRSNAWPNVPTLKEIGINLVENSPYGIAGPKGMDPKVVKILHDAFRQGLYEPSHLATLKMLDQEPMYLDSESYRKFAMQEIAEQKRIVEELGLSRRNL